MEKSKKVPLKRLTDQAAYGGCVFYPIILGGEEIHSNETEKLKPRTVAKATSQKLYFEDTRRGMKVLEEFKLPKANLVDFDGEHLSIYMPEYRVPIKEEEDVIETLEHYVETHGCGLKWSERIKTYGSNKTYKEMYQVIGYKRKFLPNR